MHCRANWSNSSSGGRNCSLSVWGAAIPSPCPGRPRDSLSDFQQSRPHQWMGFLDVDFWAVRKSRALTKYLLFMPAAIEEPLVLLPCPFCKDPNPGMSAGCNPESGRVCKWSVKCANTRCGASVTLGRRGWAIVAWNTRAGEPAPVS